MDTAEVMLSRIESVKNKNKGAKRFLQHSTGTRNMPIAAAAGPKWRMRRMTKEICERCGKAYEAGPNTHYCKECRKEIRSVAAKKRNLSDMGHAARKEKANERKNDN